MPKIRHNVDHRVVTDHDYEFLYPGAGDPKPPGGADVHLLTNGMVCVRGKWKEGEFLAWAPLPTRNQEKEKLIGFRESPFDPS